MSAGEPFDAVVLAGGEARRLGGVSKPDVVVGGRTLLEHVLDATAGAQDVVVVGPPALARPGVRTTREDPPSGGPVAGIAAGVAALGPAAGDRLVLVLACDVPRVAGAVPVLRRALHRAPGADGAQLVDAGGRPQLVALLRRGPLERALGGLVAEGGPRGVAVRRLLDRLSTVDLPAGAAADDADTWDDVARLDAVLTAGGEPDEGRARHARDDGRSRDDDRRGGPMAEDPTNAATTPGDLHRWVAQVVQALDVDPDGLDVDLLLDLARDVAHEVARPAVPVTTFLVGHAVARAGGDRAALEQVAAQVTALREAWAAGASSGPPTSGPPSGGAP